jgi:transposase
VLPDNISLLFLPPYAPELNPKENLWDEIRDKIFKNYALKSIDIGAPPPHYAVFVIIQERRVRLSALRSAGRAVLVLCGF